MRVSSMSHRLGYLVISGLFICSVVTSMLVTFLPKTAYAETAPPVPPSAECEWYGTMSRDTVVRANTISTAHVDRSFIEMVSAPVAGEVCGMNWTASYDLHYYTISQVACLGDLDYKTSTSTETRKADAQGTGKYVVGIGTDWQTGKYYPILNGDANAMFTGTQTTEVTNGCDGDTTTTSQFNVGPWNIHAGCGGNYDQNNYFVDQNAQVMSGTCSHTTSSSNPDGEVEQSYIDTYIWNFRRTTCDHTVDTDGGGVGDCDEFNQGTNHKNPADDNALDTDGDGIVDPRDNCVTIPNTDQVDFDSDNQGNLCDNDDDNDGHADASDAFPLDPTEWSDNDSDGVGDNRDTDDDNDGVPDADEPSSGTNPMVFDTDGDGVSDSQDPCPTDNTNACVDTDGDGVPNTLDHCPSVAGLVALQGCPSPAGSMKLNVNINYHTYWNDVTPNFLFLGKKGADHLTISGASSAGVEATAEQAAFIKSICITPTWRVLLDTQSRSTVPVDWSENDIDLMGIDSEFWNSPPASISGKTGSEMTAKAPLCSNTGQTGIVLNRGNLTLGTNQFLQNVNFKKLSHRLTITLTLLDGRTFSFPVVEETDSAPKKTPAVNRFDESRSFSVNL